jgi:hypothetical protein
MKISSLIHTLQEHLAQFGDLDVVVGERNSELVSKFEACVDLKGKFDNENWDDKICIIQAYHIFR